ncbi:rhomboid-related protein 4-like [Labrus bergylta]|uniref:rhomboid-related protein 4-like n=1 Tax=Labrus bergylta TaxID=56723 RepID=UPI003313A309
MQRSFQLGLLLLIVRLYQEGLTNIPVVTLTFLFFNVYNYMLPVAPLVQVCLNIQYVYTFKEWSRLLLSPLHHLNDWHLYFNMTSFLWKGIWLERRLGGAWFLYMLSVFYVLTGVVHLLLQAWLLEAVVDSKDPLMEFIRECAVGFSGVVFALKVVSNHCDPGGETYVWTIRVSNRFASWVELVLLYLIAPWTSVIANLAGILVGLLYTVGPLETIMRMCAVFVSSLRPDQHISSYYSSSGYSGAR